MDLNWGALRAPIDEGNTPALLALALLESDIQGNDLNQKLVDAIGDGVYKNSSVIVALIWVLASFTHKIPEEDGVLNAAFTMLLHSARRHFRRAEILEKITEGVPKPERRPVRRPRSPRRR